MTKILKYQTIKNVPEPITHIINTSFLTGVVLKYCGNSQIGSDIQDIW